MFARAEGELAAMHVGATALQPQIVDRALEPVYEPMAGYTLALRLDFTTVGKVADQNFNGVRQNDLETVGDEGCSGGDGVSGHRRCSLARSFQGRD